jgi:hypothetical protein
LILFRFSIVGIANALYLATQTNKEYMTMTNEQIRTALLNDECVILTNLELCNLMDWLDVNDSLDVDDIRADKAANGQHELWLA